MSTPVEKYLAHYAEPEARSVPLPERRFGHVVVIPAYDEGDNLFATLESIPGGPLGDVLIILVVNTPVTAPPRAQALSQAVPAKLGREFGRELLTADPPLFRWFAHPRGALLCVDRTGPRSLPKGQGVGLARKIGCDVALQLHVQGRIRSPWIHTTDADVKLPTAYFQPVYRRLEEGAPAALIYPFSHVSHSPAALADAMERYEVFLRYYVLGLADACSPYAFHTLGSTLAIYASAYAQVRGFPRRAAGEDFYLLNKLAKVGRVLPLNEPVLSIGGRSSDRVPFGTGAALKQILGLAARGEPYRVYAPGVFQHLKVWLAGLDLLCADLGSRRTIDCLEEAAAACPSEIEIELLLSEVTRLGFVSALAHARQISREASTMSRHLHTWFDAFRTLKLIHALTVTIPKQEMLEAIRGAAFLDGIARRPQTLTQLRRALAARERQMQAKGTFGPALQRAQPIKRGRDDSGPPVPMPCA